MFGVLSQKIMSYNIKPLEVDKNAPPSWTFTMPYALMPYLFIWNNGKVWLYVGNGEHQEMASATTFEQADAIVQALWRSAVTNWLDANLLQPPKPSLLVAEWD